MTSPTTPVTPFPPSAGTNKHSDVTANIGELRNAPPPHVHGASDLGTSGTRSVNTMMNGVGAWVQIPLTLVGSEASPITLASTPRPAGALLCYWIMAAGVSPINASGIDFIRNAP